MNGVDPRIEVYSICRKNGILLSEDQIGTLEKFVSALLEWNKKINVISRRDEENVWFSHILHCLSPLFYLDFTPGTRILDMGSGGGLPGIPLAIVRPDFHVTLLDSIRKKTMVMQDIVGGLGLSNVVVKMGRAEEVGTEKENARKFDLVVARAVGPLVDLISWASPFVTRGKRVGEGSLKSGKVSLVRTPKLLAFKGGDIEKEIAGAKARIPGITITVIRMVFEGGVNPGLDDKKLVLVNF